MNPLSHYLGSQIPQQTSFVSHRVDTPSRGGAPRLLLALVAATLLAVVALALPSGALAAGPVDHFAVTVSPRPATAGQDITITATAKDRSNATVKNYDGAATFTDSSGTLSASDPGKWINGVSATTAKVNAAIRGDVVNVQVGGIAGQSAAFNVVGPVDHLTVTVSPRPATVGQDITITTTAKDVNNLTVPSYDAKLATLKDSAGLLSASDPGQFAGGVSTTTATVSSAFHGDVVYVEDSNNMTAQSAAFNITGAVDHISLSMQSSVSAYGPFDVTARALDAAGNTVTGYSGAASWSDSAGVLSPSSPAAFVAGVSKTSATVSSPAGGDVITLTSGGLSVQRKFTAFGIVTQLDTRVPSSAKAGAPFTMTVSARDEAGNLVTNYDGSLDYYYNSTFDIVGLAPYKNGVSRNTVTWPVAAHQQQIIVTGQAAGLSNPINVFGPASLPVQTFERTDHSTSCASIRGTLTLKMEDAAGNVLSDYNANPWETDSGFVHDGPVQPDRPAPYVRGVSRTNLSIVNSDGRNQDWLLVLDGSADFMQIC